MQGEAERDRLVMTLAERALAKPAAEREAYLESTRTADAELYREVRARVEWEERTGTFLGDPISPQPSSAFVPGDLVSGRFRVIRDLGHGGMGRVYEALDEKLDRRVAIKCAIRGHQSRLSPEARAALEVSHPHVCKLHEIHTADTASGPVDFLTMEFIDGETASRRLARAGPLPEKEVRNIAVQLCSGLAQAHRQGVIHGDIKPGNLMLARTPEGQTRAVLTDFGLARLTNGPDGTAAADGGTPGYLAPELGAGSPPAVTSDIYAMGVLFHHLLTGRPPGPAGPAKLLPPWNRIAAGCLAPNPANRFQSADEIARVLTARPAVARWLLACAAIVIAVLGAVLWMNREGPPAAPIRLAVLPFTITDPALKPVSGIGSDVADRLSGVRRNFGVASPAEAARMNVRTAADARKTLNATHVLDTRLQMSHGRIAADARLIDAVTGQTLRGLTGEYLVSDPQSLAKALIATVTRTFNLPNLATRETVSAAAYPHYIRGMELLRGDPQFAANAIEHFRRAGEIDPASALPWARLGQAQIQAFRMRSAPPLAEAGKNIERARSINPDSVQVLLASAAYLRMHGNYEQAIEDLSRAAELEPSGAESWRSLAFTLEKSNRPADAVAAYRKAIEAQPDDYLNYVQLGNFHFARNEYEQAEDVYRRGVTAGVTIPAAHMNLGLALMLQGKLAEAEQSLLTALRMGRTPILLMNLGTLYYRQERFDDARRLYEEALAAAPPSPRRYRAKGDALRHVGQMQKARQAYAAGLVLADKELTVNPRKADTRGLMGLMYAHTGDRRRATSELLQALSLEPGNALVMTDAVIAWEALGERGRALEVLSRAPLSLAQQLRHDPDARRLREDARFQALLNGTPVR